MKYPPATSNNATDAEEIAYGATVLWEKNASISSCWQGSHTELGQVLLSIQLFVRDECTEFS